MAVRKVENLRRKWNPMHQKKELKHVSKKKAANRGEVYKEKRQTLVTIIAETDDSSVQYEFRR